MLNSKCHTTCELTVKCDACAAEPVQMREMHGSNHAKYQLQDEGWLFATLEIEHFRATVALCPKCAPAHAWLAKVIYEHTPPAYRRD